MQSFLAGIKHNEPYVLVIGLGILINRYLFDLYQAKPRHKGTPHESWWAEGWEFSPSSLGGFSYWKLALVSMLGLFLELLTIRWISSEIRIFACLKNFVLIACFLGFGLGCYLCRRRIKLLAMMLPLLTLLLLVKVPWPGLRRLVMQLPVFVGGVSEVHVWGVPSMPLDWSSVFHLLLALAVIVPLFAFIVFVFIPLGQLVGWYLENAGKGIFGYSVNIFGSLGGIILYTWLCFLYQPPAIWFLLAGVMLVVLLWRIPRLRWTAAVAGVVFVGLATLGPGGDSVEHWSPYQKVTLTPVREAGQVISYQLLTNGSVHQNMFDLSPAFVAGHPQLFEQVSAEWNPYNLPYRFYSQPPSVLVLGAGTGNDVAAALRNGAGRIVAVEIDPLTLKLGRELHFEKPYGSPRVQQVIDDARSYVQNTKDRFDLIVFSLLDSYISSSYFTTIRIDNYVYTIEALQAAKRLLRPDGLLIIKFWVDAPWIAGRLDGLVGMVFGPTHLRMHVQQFYYTTAGTFFICGSPERVARALSDPELAAYVQEHSQVQLQKATLTTDDWPYFYQQEPGLPAMVIVISSVLVFLVWLFLRRTGITRRTVSWHFFFLGAGFLLLEAQVISRMALLFGTTWVVNSIAIAGLLLLIVAANMLVDFEPRIPVAVGYAGIFASILVAYWIPLEKLFFPSVWLRALTSTALLCLPVFFAGIVFIRSFAGVGFRGEALGSNLLGALVGGLLESASLWTGIRSLLVIAALLYLASWIALLVKQPGASVPLEPHPGPLEG